MQLLNINKKTIDGLTFKPKGHAYTVHAVNGCDHGIYIESNTFGEDRCVTYYFDAEYDIIDQEGSLVPSDKFDSAVVALVKMHSF